MVKTFKGNVSDSVANFIVCLCDNSYDFDYDFPVLLHVDKERMKYIRHCDKNNIELFGKAQYIPSEVWALTMVDTMKNNNVTEYDANYQYIVNMFCKDAFDGKINPKFVKRAFIDILDKAKSIKATVAIPRKIESFVRDMIDKSDVDVEIWQ